MLLFMHNSWMIDPRLITFRTFASCGTIAATAELTGLSPSAVSAQLRELQRALGVRLLVKDGRGLRLTAAGRALVARSDDLVAEWESIRSEVMSEGRETQSVFGIGGFSTAAANLLAPLAARLHREQRAVRVHVVEAGPARCIDLLLSERLDLAVIVAMQSGASVGDDSRFEQFELLDDPLDVLMPSGHPLSARDSVALEELAREPWITDGVGGPYRALFTAAFTAAGITPHVAHEAVEWETAIALVGAGLGLGLVPRLVSVANSEHVVRVRIAGVSRPVRRISAVVRKGSATSPLIAHSLVALRHIASEILATRLAEEVESARPER